MINRKCNSPTETEQINDSSKTPTQVSRPFSPFTLFYPFVLPSLSFLSSFPSPSFIYLFIFPSPSFKQLSKSKCLSSSHVRLFVIPWPLAPQAPLSMGFSRQEYWSGLPFPSPRIKPRFPTLQEDSLPPEPPGRPINSFLEV